MAMSGRRIACLILALTVVGLGCANGRPKPMTCAVIGGLAGAGAGIAGGHEYLEHSYDEWKTASYATGGAVVLGAAGYYLCKLAQVEEAPPPPPPPPAPEPAVAPPPPPAEVVAEKIVLRGVNFDFDKSDIRPDAAIILDEAVSILSGKPGVGVRVEGHTDSTGPDAYNQGLSERRAASVRKYLVDHGIGAARLTSVGFGESRPIATNDTREGRALNRRVELHVLE
jgi:OOP family OmpA-OmpF porin